MNRAGLECRSAITGTSQLVKKSAALGISCSGGARDPQVFHYTLRLLVPSLGLAPVGLARRFAPGETLLRSGGTRPPFARDDFFTSSQAAVYLTMTPKLVFG
ncbi:MAG: hypothetical protein ACREYE_10205 [Gammaproteobacteria bacterium]